MRAFIVGILRDMRGNALLSLSGGRTEPTEAAPHGKLIVDQHHWFAYPEELDLMVKFAEKAKADQRDAYISPIVYGDAPFVTKKNEVITQRRDGRPIFTRAKTNALFAQTIYMDSDSCPPEAFKLPPSRHVQTSEGHGHDYWFLPQPVPVQIAAELAHKITTFHKDDGCDPSGWSPNKVLRLPTWNTTYDEISPFEVTWKDDDVDPVTGEAGDLVYNITDIQQVYGDVKVDEVPFFGPSDLPPVPPIEGLPDFETLAQRIPATERRLNDLLYKTPKTGPGGWRSEQRYALLLDLKRFGFTDEETVALAWHAPVAQKFREDGRNVDGLWWELQVRVKPVLALETGQSIEPSPEPVEKARRYKRLKLLTDAQRADVENRHDLVTLYLEHARSKVRNMNRPYHVINAWIILSLGLAEAADLPKDPRNIGLGLYTFTVGKSSSGKDEADAVFKPFVDKLFLNDHPEIPALSSKEMLIETLLERSDRVTLIRENEADGLLREVRRGGGYLSALLPLWTRAYDGEVPSLGKVGRKELNQPGRHAILTMKMIGTPEGILRSIDTSMFYTGYLARQIWVLGEEFEVTEESMRSKFRRGERERRVDLLPAYFASRLAALRARLYAKAPLDRKRAELDPTDEAIELLDAARWKIYQHVQQEQDMELWKPVLNRFGDILWKIAGLSAASNGRTVIGSFDVMVALYHAEDWIANATEIADRVADTAFSKACDEIEAFINAREGREAEMGAIYRFRKGENPKDTETYLGALVKQGRIEERTPARGEQSRYYRIKKGRS
jgi:hypothetical protein